jgi:hypothetical protein
MSRSTVPSEPCGRKAKRTGGQPCRIRVRGGGPCRVHGENGVTRAARLRRVALAEALAADPRRDPREVLSDVAHAADHLMRRARAEVSADRPTAKTMAKLIELTETAGRWAKTALDAGVAERQARVAEAQGAMVAAVLSAIFDDLALDERQLRLVPQVVPRRLRELTGGGS